MFTFVPFPVPHTLLVALDARYVPTKKCGNANVNEPNPINITPQPSQRGFDAPKRPPKYVTGTKHTNDAMSYPLATKPVCDDRNPKRRSIVVMTTFINPFTSKPII